MSDITFNKKVLNFHKIKLRRNPGLNKTIQAAYRNWQYRPLFMGTTHTVQDFISKLEIK